MQVSKSKDVPIGNFNSRGNGYEKITGRRENKQDKNTQACFHRHKNQVKIKANHKNDFLYLQNTKNLKIHDNNDMELLVHSDSQCKHQIKSVNKKTASQHTSRS